MNHSYDSSDSQCMIKRTARNKNLGIVSWFPQFMLGFAQQLWYTYKPKYEFKDLQILDKGESSFTRLRAHFPVWSRHIFKDPDQNQLTMAWESPGPQWSLSWHRWSSQQPFFNVEPRVIRIFIFPPEVKFTVTVATEVQRILFNLPSEQAANGECPESICLIAFQLLFDKQELVPLLVVYSLSVDQNSDA